MIKAICYPSPHRSKIRALNYGCQHENKAAQQFTEHMGKSHINFGFEKFGFLIHPDYPYFGASPDGLVGCDCCGLSLVEIKCPFCARFSGISEKIGSKNFYLDAKKGKIVLKENHQYYYQIQMQLALSKTDRCFLVVWSAKELIHLEVKPNPQFWTRE